MKPDQLENFVKSLLLDELMLLAKNDKTTVNFWNGVIPYPKTHNNNYGTGEKGIFNIDWLRCPEGYDFWANRVRFFIEDQIKDKALKLNNIINIKSVLGNVITLKDCVVESVYGESDTHYMYTVNYFDSKILLLHNKNYSRLKLSKGDIVNIKGEIESSKNNDHDAVIHFTHRTSGGSEYGYILKDNIYYD